MLLKSKILTSLAAHRNSLYSKQKKAQNQNSKQKKAQNQRF